MIGYFKADCAITPKLKPLAEITRAEMQVLYKEIGPVNTIRFLNQSTTGHGNYTAEGEQVVGVRFDF